MPSRKYNSMHTVLSVPCSIACCGQLLVKGWPLGCSLLRDVSCVFITSPYGALDQVWRLIVLIPDLCNLLYFHTFQQCKILARDTVAMPTVLRMSLCQTAKVCFLVANRDLIYM